MSLLSLVIDPGVLLGDAGFHVDTIRGIQESLKKLVNLCVGRSNMAISLSFKPNEVHFKCCRWFVNAMIEPLLGGNFRA